MLVIYIFVAMNMEQYISQLLYRYPCVTVPNFGAFLSETISATIQENNHTFFPPKKAISFNAYIKNNDGLLASHIAQLENCSYDEAVTKINLQVTFWLNKLNNRDFLIFKNIGLLKLNGENNIVFEAYDHTNYLTDSFGLSSYVSPEIKREILKTIIKDDVLKEEITEKVIPVVPVKEIKGRHFTKYAAAIVISLGASGFGYLNYINQQEKVETLLVQKEVQKEVQSKIQEATFFISPTVINGNTDDIKYPFHIVSGAYRSEENANRAVKALFRKGYEARVIEKNDHELYPVIYQSFISYPEAQEKLKEIQRQENKDAWLLIKEL